MFVDEKQQGEAQTAEQANRKLKLSEAIRIGKPLVNENTQSYRLCAIGCAWAGVKGAEMSLADQDRLYTKLGGSTFDGFMNALANETGFSRSLLDEISDKHCGGWPALRIAADLEARGY